MDDVETGIGIEALGYVIAVDAGDAAVESADVFAFGAQQFFGESKDLDPRALG